MEIKQQKRQEQIINHHFPVYLNIQTKHDKPALEIRTLTTNHIPIKVIITAAFHGQPIAVFPTFRNRLRALATLCEKGIIKYNPEKQEYIYQI